MTQRDAAWEQLYGMAYRGGATLAPSPEQREPAAEPAPATEPAPVARKRASKKRATKRGGR